MRDPIVAELERRIGVTLADAGLALAALTHKSFVNEHRGEPLQDNERLEFLGDAVLDLAVSHRLMERFPVAREGELSKIRAAVVDEPGLALIARELDLGSLLRLGRGEELTGGREKSSLLADALEAVVAAVYLSGGLDPVLALIDRFLGDAFARAAAGTLDRDYKTQLQELAQSRMRSAPRYRVVAEHGPDHSKTFEVELEIGGEVIGRGSGRSKKDAEQASAKLALEVLRPAAPPSPDPAAAPATAPEPPATDERDQMLAAAEPVPAAPLEEVASTPAEDAISDAEFAVGAERKPAVRRRRTRTTGSTRRPPRGASRPRARKPAKK